MMFKGDLMDVKIDDFFLNLSGCCCSVGSIHDYF